MPETPKHYDVAVVGLGAHGSSSLYHLAKRGVKVIGFDRFDPPHTDGSHHGDTRLIRYAYGEGSYYVPLLKAARKNWKALEQESGESLLHEVGILELLDSETEFARNAVKSAETFNLNYEILDSDQIEKRYPVVKTNDLPHGHIDCDAGYLLSEKIIAATLKLARSHGAKTVINTPVQWQKEGADYQIKSGDEVLARADKVIITNGAWFSQSAPTPITNHIYLARLTLHWFKPKPGHDEKFSEEKLPGFQVVESADLEMYGFPLVDGLVKMGCFHVEREKINEPEQLNKEINKSDVEKMQYWVKKYLPDLDPIPVKSVACKTTCTSDEDFILGPNPDDPNVIFGHACSGHGFKFASVVGEILADLATTGHTDHDISHHDPKRFYK